MSSTWPIQRRRARRRRPTPSRRAQKFHCPACGAEAHWNPAKQALICPFCGTESPATLQTRGADTVIVEHDLVAALRDIPDAARGWQAEKTSVRCQSCQAISVFDADKVGRRCDFCGSAQLVPYEQVKDAFRPESLLPLKISESQARDSIRAWYGRQWLAPNKLNAKALTDTVKGIYLPYWTFDAQGGRAAGRPRPATYYYTREGGKHGATRALDAGVGRAVARLRRRAGVRVDGRATPAGCAASSRFRPTRSVPYDAGYLAGWTVERYQIDLVARPRRSRQQMEATLRAALRRTRCPATRIATSCARDLHATSASSTSSRRSGC